MKVSSLNMILKDGDFAEVLLNIDLTQTEANELGVNMGTILNLLYDDTGFCFAHGILEGGDFIEFDLTEVERNNVNQFIYDNGIYVEVMSMFLDEKAS
jgi:hypothetical protein